MKRLGILLASLSVILLGCAVGKTIYNDSYLVINVLDKKLFLDCHIKGSVSVPFDLVDDFATKVDKNVPVVFYCSNYSCTASGIARDRLKALGFTDVKAYEGGIAEWYQLGFPTEGPAQSGYLTGENERPLDYWDDADHITAETLHQHMVDYGLL
ncbi:rhodanese-like domain-containing protein [Candidatus Babeliales bacterium]|nr:rhodanese-like domain-containing protein [Candidatus Babeliales bacterium]